MTVNYTMPHLFQYCTKYLTHLNEHRFWYKNMNYLPSWFHSLPHPLWYRMDHMVYRCDFQENCKCYRCRRCNRMNVCQTLMIRMFDCYNEYQQYHFKYVHTIWSLWIQYMYTGILIHYGYKLVIELTDLWLDWNPSTWWVQFRKYPVQISGTDETTSVQCWRG